MLFVGVLVPCVGAEPVTVRGVLQGAVQDVFREEEHVAGLENCRGELEAMRVYDVERIVRQIPGGLAADRIFLSIYSFQVIQSV